MSRFFIDRPIFASVLAILVVIAGILAIRSLPLSQFPDIAPPAVQIRTTYPGADAATLETTTTAVIEQQINGIDNLRYFSSTSDALGNLTIIVTFEQGTNPDVAQVQVQNKLQQAVAMLPPEVQRQGVRVEKTEVGHAMIVALYSTNGSHDDADLGDMLASQFDEPISRVKGVGNTELMGAQYAMRVWVDPLALANRGLTFGDVKAAILVQNAQVSVGQIGGRPAPNGQAMNFTVSAQSRMQTPEQFGGILLKTEADGSTVRLRDVARVEIGAENYNYAPQIDYMPAAGLGIRLTPGANALETIDAVKARVEEIARQLPPDVQVTYAWDVSSFIKPSIRQIITTLIEAVILVFLVMFLFLQNWRATLIPTIAVPVVLMGTSAVLYIAGFSINTLTLFGMVLATGLLVDDAIVVVENVERLIQREGLTPAEAARRSMDELSGALIGIGVVLSAVFLPMAFFGGSTGVIYRQFSITIVTAMVFSVLVALTLTPALCATILKPANGQDYHRMTGFLGWFNRTFDRGMEQYSGRVVHVTRNWKRTMLIYGLIGAVMVVLFARLPSGFLPEEDQGVIVTQVTMPVGSTLPQTMAVIDKMKEHFLVEDKGITKQMFSIGGFTFGGQGQNTGAAFIRLKDGRGSDDSAAALAARANVAFGKIRSGQAIAFIPPAVVALGVSNGFDAQLVDVAGIGHDRLIAARDQMLVMAAREPMLAQVRSNGLDDVPIYKIDVDQPRAAALGLDLKGINETLSTAIGGSYVNDFLDRGRPKKVFVQADASFRGNPADIGSLYARGSRGDMSPFSAFSDGRWSFGAARLERYDGNPSIELLGGPAPGHSTGEAMARMEQLAARLPAGVALRWTGLSYEEQLSGGQAPMLYALSILIVFLALAALYESWSVPLAVILVVPLGVIGALLAAWLTGLDNNIYLQVGLITTVGVAAKNAILIVEFAEKKLRGGLPVAQAAIEAAQLRLRPIIMTSLTFVFGVLPLTFSSGSGAGGQHAIGRSVVGGMISATALGIFLVPTFFVVVKRLFRSDNSTVTDDARDAADAADAAAVDGRQLAEGS